MSETADTLYMTFRAGERSAAEVLLITENVMKLLHGTSLIKTENLPNGVLPAPDRMEPAGKNASAVSGFLDPAIIELTRNETANKQLGFELINTDSGSLIGGALDKKICHFNLFSFNEGG
jgi:hypothetical protein